MGYPTSPSIFIKGASMQYVKSDSDMKHFVPGKVYPYDPARGRLLTDGGEWVRVRLRSPHSDAGYWVECDEKGNEIK